MKLTAVRKVVEGKRVDMIDDSIVRGTTLGSDCEPARDAGAKEVHVRISSPPYIIRALWNRYADAEGTDRFFQKREQIRQAIQADSLVSQ